MVMLLGEKVIYFYMVAGTSRAWIFVLEISLH